jgi:hypothetical protein
MGNTYKLIPSVRAQLTDAFRHGEAEISLDDYLRPLEIGRDLPVDLVGELLTSAQERFSDSPPASDRWLSPRVHAALRLTRAEAADRGLWSWLAVVKFPDYVRWRYPGRASGDDGEASGTPLKRFVGQDRDNAVSRLWWSAELFRNGPDYTPVEQAFVMQDIPNTWLSLNAVHHRVAPQAALRILPSLDSKQINRLSTALDHVLTTIQLDAVAPDAGPDAFAIEEWVADSPDRDVILGNTSPRGPEEDPVDPEKVGAVEQLLRDVARAIGLPLAEPVKADA